MELHTFTVSINFIFLITAFWLGIYVVTRSPRSMVAWLTGLTLWSLAGLFLNVFLALNPPPIVESPPWWLRLLMPFWPEGAMESGAGGWLQGWLVAPAVAFWHHATILMRPGRRDRWRAVRVIFVYMAALVAILIHVNTSLIFDDVSGDPLYLNSMQAGSLFPLFFALLIIFTTMSLVNLFRSGHHALPGMPKKQFDILILATLIAGMIGPVGILGFVIKAPVPMAVFSLLLGIAVIMLGYGVARYSALMEGRTIRRDFMYNAISIGSITLLYLAAAWLSVRIYNVQIVAFIFVILLAIVTHSLIDIGRQAMDSLFFLKEKRQLRANLRSLAHFVGEQSLEENLNNTLKLLCTAVRATYGLLLSFEEGQIRTLAVHRWSTGKLSQKPVDLYADDVTHLEAGALPRPLAEAALLAPLYFDAEQFGALVLGRPINGTRYSPADVDLLLYPIDQLAVAISEARREAEYMTKLSELTKARKSKAEKTPGDIPVKLVELALRNLYDFAYLGDTQLAELRLVHNRLPSGPMTHLDRGKGVHSVLSEAINKLRPESDLTGNPPAREWYPYIILHCAYLEDQSNRDIMAQLYISEGTFNRTRRAAIRSVTRVLVEMEAALH